jgi:hypothetical protein
MTSTLASVKTLTPAPTPTSALLPRVSGPLFHGALTGCQLASVCLSVTFTDQERDPTAGRPIWGVRCLSREVAELKRTRQTGITNTGKQNSSLRLTSTRKHLNPSVQNTGPPRTRPRKRPTERRWPLSSSRVSASTRSKCSHRNGDSLELNNN